MSGSPAQVRPLKYFTPKLSVREDVAIVGSSASILARSYGTEIDRWGTVIRFNRQQVAGFEAHVGSRTNLRMVNAHVFMSQPFHRWKVDTEFVRKLRDTRIGLQDLEPGLERRRADYIDDSNELFVFQIRKLRHQAQRLCGRYLGLPTMGMAAILACIDSGIHPWIYGWDVESDAPLSHYWETRDQRSPHHRIKEERAALRYLQQQGKLTIAP